MLLLVVVLPAVHRLGARALRAGERVQEDEYQKAHLQEHELRLLREDVVEDARDDLVGHPLAGLVWDPRQHPHAIHEGVPSQDPHDRVGVPLRLLPHAHAPDVLRDGRPDVGRVSQHVHHKGGQLLPALRVVRLDDPGEPARGARHEPPLVARAHRAPRRLREPAIHDRLHGGAQAVRHAGEDGRARVGQARLLLGEAHRSAVPHAEAPEEGEGEHHRAAAPHAHRRPWCPRQRRPHLRLPAAARRIVPVDFLETRHARPLVPGALACQVSWVSYCTFCRNRPHARHRTLEVVARGVARRWLRRRRRGRGRVGLQPRADRRLRADGPRDLAALLGQAPHPPRVGQPPHHGVDRPEAGLVDGAQEVRLAAARQVVGVHVVVGRDPQPRDHKAELDHEHKELAQQVVQPLRARAPLGPRTLEGLVVAVELHDAAPPLGRQRAHSLHDGVPLEEVDALAGGARTVAPPVVGAARAAPAPPHIARLLRGVGLHRGRRLEIGVGVEALAHVHGQQPVYALEVLAHLPRGPPLVPRQLEPRHQREE